jgi:small-conductance mechanosensitive channel
LGGIISTQKGVESKPVPQVLAHQFAESSINFRLLFWCHIDAWIDVKSEVLMKVHQAFNENGIEIPFPQRDINIKDAGKLFSADEKKDDEKTET